MINAEELNLFPTKVITTPIEGIDIPSALEYVYSLRGAYGSIQASNIGGWQLPIEYSDTPLCTILNKMVSLANRKYGGGPFQIDNAWININKSGDYNTPHIHPGSVLSGCLYLKVPAGDIYFIDPRPMHRFTTPMEQSTYKSIKPMEGSCIIFPSWLEHGVTPYPGEGDRVTIAFNMIHQGVPNDS